MDISLRTDLVDDSKTSSNSNLGSSSLQEIEEAAWLAGFFDGEGNITFTQNGSGWTNLRLGLAQNERKELDKVRARFGGRVWPVGSRCHHWELTDAPGIRTFLKFVLPYLRVKKQKAELALEFAQLMKGRGKRLTETEKEQRARILTLVMPNDDDDDVIDTEDEEWEDELPGNDNSDDDDN